DAHPPSHGGRALSGSDRSPVDGQPGRDVRGRGGDDRRLPHVVVVHTPLHQRPGVRVRVCLRAAARPVGLRTLPRGGSVVCAPIPRAVGRGRLARSGGARGDRRDRPRRSRLLGFRSSAGRAAAAGGRRAGPQRLTLPPRTAGTNTGVVSLSRWWKGIPALVAVSILLAASAVSAAAPRQLRVGRAPPVPTGAAVLGRLAPTTPISTTVVLKPRDPAALEAYATAVSTPGSNLYHHYLSVSEFRQQFGPTDS